MEDDRLARLSDGIPRLPRRLTKRERIANHVFLWIQLGRLLLPVGFGWFGAVRFGAWGAAAGGAAGLVACLWMRRSAGVRRDRPGRPGWYVRIRERADGDPRGVIEWFLETLRGNALTLDRCRRIAALEDDATARLARVPDRGAQEKILIRLDADVKAICYED